MQSKKDLSEADIKAKYITPAVKNAGWDENLQFRREVSLTDGRIIVKGSLFSRGRPKQADYILYYKPNIPVAIIEAKNNKHSVRSGIQQALSYRELLEDVPCVYSSNGDSFFEHDFTCSNGKLEREIPLDEFPSPEELWKRYKKLNNIDKSQEKAASQDYFYDSTGRTPRYYQQIAVNRIVESIAKGEKRVLLVLATGTGKTYVAFQSIYRLWKSGIKKRILFLADRNALINQTKTGDFKHFGQALHVIRNKKIDKSYEIYLALYQGLTGYDENKDAFRRFSREFFDLVVIDECHRGSAAEDSAWREILEYFSSAAHIGLTATPKETKDVSNIDYFGNPVYTYSLKKGIDDGFLAPYQVVRIGINVDLQGWRPENGKLDLDGRAIEDREYNIKDYDRNLVIEERTSLAADKITEYMKKTNRFSKTIVFCVDIEHAERMTEALRNANQDLVCKNSKYVMQITGDNLEGKRELDNFQNPESDYPVIVTTSKLLTTGVDVPTCRNIVLDANIVSMTEFKQIIGRGTRLCPDFNKLYFTIIDFRANARNFADPDFDGPPIQESEFEKDDNIDLPEPDNTDQAEDDPGETEEDPLKEGDPDYSPDNSSEQGGEIIETPRKKVVVNGVEVHVLSRIVQYYREDGKLTTKSLEDFTKANILKNYQSLDRFLIKWQAAEKKQAVIEELENQGIFLKELEALTGKDMDPFDIVCHLAFDMPPLSRKERAEKVRKRNYFAKYGDNAQKVLENLLDKYADQGIENIETLDVLKLDPLKNIGTPREIFGFFGDKNQYLNALNLLKQEIYKAA
ncbi:putative Type III endonuclease, res subunit [Desulfonema limicola]|uniref:Type III endonuclease, res subunit n=1 Tax=Desulfonema limicola TaxID=45656 RepID=A0A975B7F5_9BACT|nr:DEAD/DEAH box helicase family protein [Desulfonema limicola]QTA80236.1 putative Type III endonuclease, res subunit [Desulfonema limicola]